MKRSPLKRKTPLLRKSRVNPRNDERRRELHAIQFDGGICHDGFVRDIPCAVAQKRGDAKCQGAIQAAHVTSRGAGGRWYHTVPLCAGHHQEQGERGLALFEARYDFDLCAMAQRLTQDHLTMIGAIP